MQSSGKDRFNEEEAAENERRGIDSGSLDREGIASDERGEEDFDDDNDDFLSNGLDDDENDSLTDDENYDEDPRRTKPSQTRTGT
ncbi:MAG TPA: hypothetical protein VFR70_03895, partial [Flavobacterium sp.]|nr:hypothetical protein [Flavobacterium sp.]